MIFFRKINLNKLLPQKSSILLLCILAVACHRKTVPDKTLGGTGRVHTEMGYASYYADKFEGKKTASGELFQQSNYTAAHKHLPFGTQVSVINLTNHKSVIVRINDRGPFVKGRIIDLSKSAAKKLDMLRSGIIKVKIKYRK